MSEVYPQLEIVTGLALGQRDFRTTRVVPSAIPVLV